MEIKTLAQILAENLNTSTQSNKSKIQKTQKKSAQQSSAEQSNLKPSARKQVDQNSDRFHQQYPTKKTPRAKPSFAHHRATSNMDSKSDNDLPFATANHPQPSQTTSQSQPLTQPKTSAQSQPKRQKRHKKKTFHPASPYRPKVTLTEPVKEVNPNSIKNLLAQVKAEAKQSNDSEAGLNVDSQSKTVSDTTTDNTNTLDNLPEALKVYLKTPEQREAEKEEIKANSRLRWLAFYYLSRREHSAQELKDKLIAKEQDPEKIDELLAEFRDKGYQSDYRTAIMLIREGIRKRYGRVRIKNDFYKRKVDMPTNIDELIDMAMADNEAFVDVISDNELVEGVDWLRLAVEARVKKYGDDIPTEQKIKARQLRFLQYRGFKPDICFEAIKHNLQTLDERF